MYLIKQSFITKVSLYTENKYDKSRAVPRLYNTTISGKFSSKSVKYGWNARHII